MQWVIQSIIVLLISFCGTVIQGATGFGMALFCMALMPFFLPLDLATIAVMWIGVFSAIVIMAQVYKHINWKFVVFPIISVVIARYIGVWIVSGTDVTVIKGILGVVLIILAVYLAFFNQKLHFKANAVSGLIAGGVSGLMGGMFNVSGPPMVAYMFNATTDKMEYTASLQVLFVVGGLSNVVSRALLGKLLPAAGWQSLVACVAAGIVGSLIGGRVGVNFLKKLDRKQLSIGVYCVMAVSGIVNILQAFGIMP